MAVTGWTRPAPSGKAAAAPLSFRKTQDVVVFPASPGADESPLGCNDAPFAWNALQGLAAAVTEAQPRARCQVLHGTRHQDLASTRELRDAGEVQREDLRPAGRDARAVTGSRSPCA